MVGIIPPSTLQKWRLYLTDPHYTTRNDVAAILREFKVRNTVSGGTFFFWSHPLVVRFFLSGFPRPHRVPAAQKQSLSRRRKKEPQAGGLAASF